MYGRSAKRRINCILPVCPLIFPLESRSLELLHMALKHSFVIAFMAFTFQVSSVTGNDGVTDSVCPVDSTSFVVSFLEDPKLENDKLAMYVKPTCTNVPKFNTRSTNSSWENRVNEIRVPDKYCILVFDERDCCGRSLLITINGPSLQDKADWIGKVKSFATCEYSGGCPKNGGEDSSFAIFYNSYQKNNPDTLAMEIQDCCSNIPETKNLHPTKDELWSTSIREIKLPPGKNIRAFDNPDCKGIHLDVPHGADTKYVFFSLVNTKVKSFIPISQEMVATPCHDQRDDLPWYTYVKVTGDEFPITVYGDKRDKNDQGIELTVKPTCSNVPTSVFEKYKTGILYLIGKVENCVCVFDKYECTGESRHMATAFEDFLHYVKFYNKTQSFRACNSHINIQNANARR